MPIQAATQHALQVARQVIQRGLVDRNAARVLYREYCSFLGQGVAGSFTQLLLVRGLVNRSVFDHLQKTIPPPPEALAQTAAPAGASEWGSSARIPTAVSKAFREMLIDDNSSEPSISATQQFEAIVPPGTEVSASHQEYNPLASTSASSEGDSQEDGGAAETPAGESVEWEPEDTLDLPEVGDKVGGYRLLELIGQGGGGVIFKAKKIGEDDSPVRALKLLISRRGAAGDRLRKRFEREIKSLQRFDHPGIVRVHDWDSDAKAPWYVMSYVAGRDLSELIREGSLTFEERLDAFVKVCAAISHVHSHNVVHRDIKPGNLILTSDGPVVLDLGLAKIIEDDEDLSLTRTGATIGTPYYMAPEQLLNPRAIDARTDVFALGILLYELVTGTLPFPGDYAGEVSDRIIHLDPKPPSEVDPNIPAALDPIVAKALAKQPSDRYASAEGLARALDAIAPKTTEAAAPSEPPGGGVPLGVVVGLVLGASLTWALVSPGDSSPAPGSTDPRANGAEVTVLGDPAPVGSDQPAAGDAVAEIPVEPAQAGGGEAASDGPATVDSRTLAQGRDRAVAARLVVLAESLGAEAPQAAERLLVEAVRLDATPRALKALERVRESLAAARTQAQSPGGGGAASSGLSARAGAEEARADAALETGREQFLAGEDPLAVRKSYLVALSAAQRAGALAPEEPTYRAKLEEVALELSAILRQEGRWDVAEALLAANGIDSARVPLHPPLDPYLVVEEGNRVALQRAFVGGLKIEPTKAFEPLRRRIAGLGDRYRIWIRLISKALPGTPPRVTTSAIWVRCEKKEAGTRTQWVSVRIPNGSYERVVQSVGAGSVLLAFDRVKGSHGPELISQLMEQVDTAAQRLIHQDR